MLTPDILALLRSLSLDVRRRLAACEGPGWWIVDGCALRVSGGPVEYAIGSTLVWLEQGRAWLPASEDAILGVVVALLTERGWDLVRIGAFRSASGSYRIEASGLPDGRVPRAYITIDGPDLRTAALALLARVAGEILDMQEEAAAEGREGRC